MTFRQWLNLEETTLYHGTRSGFDTLEPRKARFGTGISFTTNPDIAQNYALGKYKGGKTTGAPVVKSAQYSGNSFNFHEPVSSHVAEAVVKQIEPYTTEFTPEKQRWFLRNCQGSWRESGERFYREIQRSFAKRGTDNECKLAKSRNAGLESCLPCGAFNEMPDLLNSILLNIGYDALCYDDTNDGIDHRCYFLINKSELKT